jgi:hypothetical protein
MTLKPLIKRADWTASSSHAETVVLIRKAPTIHHEQNNTHR